MCELTDKGATAAAGNRQLVQRDRMVLGAGAVLLRRRLLDGLHDGYRDNGN